LLYHLGMYSALAQLKQSNRVLEQVLTLGTALIVCLGCIFGIGIRVEAQSEKDPMLVHYTKAHDALRSGDQDSACLEYKAFVGEAIHRIANARARIGDLGAVDQNFTEALSFANESSEVRLDYASVLFDQNRLAESRSMAQSALDLDPGNARAETVLGRISFQERRYPEAAAQLEAAAAAGGFGENWRLLTLAYLRSQQPDRAKPALALALRTLGDTARTRVLIAMTYYYGDYPQDAIAELRKALALDPRAPDAHYFLGLAYLANNEAAGYATAVPEFEAQLQVYPEDFRARYMLGYIALQQHQFVEAEQELLQATRINPSDAGTKLLLAQLYSETGRGKQAESVLRALTTAPKNGRPVDFTIIRAHYMLGRLLQQEGQIQDGASEIGVAEKLRRELRASAGEAYAARTSTVLAGQDSNNALPQPALPAAHVSPEEQARVRAFVQQLGPMIGEAYYTLGGISALHKDPETASRYSARAVAWDPSLASLVSH